MAGIEQLEIHSKSYIVRWVKVDDGHTISWSVQPHKKSINFGIVKHPGTGGTTLTSQSEDAVATPPPESSQVGSAPHDGKTGLFAKRDASTAQDLLAKKGFIPLKWHGKCEADKVSMGTYDVKAGGGGMFGLVFDNTFSKQTSKTATFVLLTYPTGNPPQTTHHLPNLQGGSNADSSRTSLGKHSSPRLGGIGSDSVDSLHSHPAAAAGGRNPSIAGRSEPGGAGTGTGTGTGTPPATYHVGTLMKRRRKKGQGYARRFFSLDYTTCTLSYYHNRNTSALRGAIPLSLAAVAADESRREITIDSGAEVWHLRASNAREFNEWARALERASRIARGLEMLPDVVSGHEINAVVVVRPDLDPPNTRQEADREWQQVEALVSRVVGTRDALRRLVKDMAAQKTQQMSLHPSSSSSFLSPATLSDDSESYFTPAPADKRPPFWKRKASASPLTPLAFSPSVASALAVPTPGSVATATSAGDGNAKRRSRGGGSGVQEERSVHDHCQSLLTDLDSVVHEFSTLLATSKRRRMPAAGPPSDHPAAAAAAAAASRNSLESTTSTTDEFFDAEAGEGGVSQSQLVRIEHHSEEEEAPLSDGDEALTTHDSSSSASSVDEEGRDDTYASEAACLHPVRPKSLAPLPITDPVVRRTTIPPATVPPPSLIAFVRKNVGKDLSTISMPVSANEPTSLLQRVAEQLEYADLLSRAAGLASPRERMIHVAAFAVSQFSGGRAKERAVRKPFNPLLGETYELLRSEREEVPPGGFRLLVEKISHRPVRLAMQADAAGWSFAQSPAPTQKFWGKSAELTTEGRARVCLRLGDGSEERFSWTVATVFLRNVVMGEKYVEPVGTMTVANDTTGARATVEFRSRGMFGGRGEDVVVEVFGADGRHAGIGLQGTWTAGLRTVTVEKGGEEEREVWRPGRLVENAGNTYGMTTFAAGMNEVTALEKGRLPPTDTRLRPDQRLAEQGRLDEAEEWKVRLEEAQRRRRREMEEKGEEWRPRWFVQVAAQDGGEEVWKIKSGKDGYWEERGRGVWNGVEDIFGVSDESK